MILDFRQEIRIPLFNILQIKLEKRKALYELMCHFRIKIRYLNLIQAHPQML